MLGRANVTRSKLEFVFATANPRLAFMTARRTGLL